MPIITDGSENFSSVEEEKRVSYDSDEDFLQIMNKDDHLESVKVEMTEVRKENKRLKITLARMMEDYKSLETHLYDIKEQEDKGKNAKTYLKELETQQDDMLSLSLGTFVPNKSSKKEDESNYISNKEDKQMKSALSLGLECNFEDNQIPEEPSSNVSQENSSEAVEEYTPDNHSKTTGNEDDEVSQLIRLKKARVSVRARCEAPTMNDGCQWRKYGQKIAKGNPRPRAYYRCTLAPSCPVKKQVQRCAEDMSILITTYEGTHNHSLPASATAMASATSEAASMLVSGSSTSLSSTFGSSSSISSSLHGLKFNLFDDSRLRKIYLSNSCFSSSPYHPTITLDLTSSISTSPFNSFSSPLTSIFSCNGSSTSSNSSPSISNPLQTLSWSKKDYLNKADLNLYSKNAAAGTFDLDMIQSQSQDFFRRPLIQKGIHGSQSISLLNENIAAATKVITSDPSFQSILAAAISSVMVKGNEVHGRNQTLPVIGSVDQRPKWGDTISSHLSSNGVGCVSASTTLLNQQIEPNTTHGNFSFSLPPLSFSPYKKTPGASALYNRDQAK